MAKRPSEIIGIKIRVREDMRREIEKLAKKNGQSVNQEIVNLLDAALLAERMGLGGVEGVIKAAQKNAHEAAFEEIIKRLNLDKLHAE